MANYADPGTFSVSQPTKLQPASLLVILAGIIAVSFAVFMFVQISSNTAASNNLDQSLATDSAQLAKLAPTATKIDNYDKLATSLRNLFQAQHRWEGVLGTIESKLYKNMKVTSLQVNDKGVITLSGATPNFTEYAKVYSSFLNEQTKTVISNVQVVSVAKSEKKDASEVNFSFQGTLTAQALATGSLLSQ